MLTTPAFKPIYQVATANDETVFLFSETGESILQGRAYALLAPLIDGQRTVDELVERLADQAPLTELYYALMTMESQGYLMESDSTIPTHIAAFWHNLNIDPQTAVQALQETTVTITVFGDLDADPLVQRLQDLSIPVASEGTFHIVLTDDYLRHDLQAYNEQALYTRHPWLLAKPVGSTIWLGPVFRPNETGCWECLAQRLRTHRNTELYLQQQKSVSAPIVVSHAQLPSAFHATLDMIATEVAKAIVLGERHALHGSLISMDWRTLQTESHKLVHRPQCPTCGDEYYFPRRTSPITLSSQRKEKSVHGGERTVTPEETLQKYGHHVSPITGILHKLERSNNTGSGPVHNYVAGLNHAVKQNDNLQMLRHHLRTNSGGKGVTDLQAKAGALCEAIERYSIRYHRDEDCIRSTYEQLGSRAIHPNQCMLFSQRQFDNRDEFNRQNRLPGRQIPLPFDENRVMEWTPVWSLTEQTFKYLPTVYCFFGYPTEPDSFFCKADSNGCAAGNTIEEAILQGFMELAERDSVGMWWYNRVSRPAVDLDSFGLPYITQLQEYYRSLNRELWVLDVTNDLEIPSFVAVSRALDKPSENILCGFGAHFNPEIGLLRALTEMNQFLPNLLHWERSPFVDGVTTEWWKTATLDNQPYLKPDPTQPAKRASEYRYVATEDIRDDVLACQRIIEEKGLELLVLNQTRPDLELPVVKVIVPGIRHFWNRFAPGRLYDVPVQLNWIPAPRREEELNPISMFF